MVWGQITARAVGPVWGASADASVAEALAAVFDDDPDDDEADEEDDPAVPFGVLRARWGWVGAAGPGVALRFPVRTDLSTDAAGVEVRLRSDGRYVRSALARLGDRDKDLTLRPELEPSDVREELFVVTTFLPYAAIGRHAGALTLEAWLTEDGDPVEESLWPLELPEPGARLLDGPLGAVAVAAVSAGARDARALARLFGLDATGLRVAELLVGADLATPAEDVFERWLDALSPRAFARVHAWLCTLADADADFLDILAGLCGLGGGGPVDPALAKHYAVLGLQPGAAWEAVRAAYRRFARLYHPDRVHGSPKEGEAHDRMKRINAAHAALREALEPRR